jgi:4'-phosphopantetheinyl transferase
MRRAEDRTRQVLGAVLLRLAAGAATGTPPASVVVDRTCPRCAEPHGKPHLPDTGLHASITHSGDLVGLALTPVAPVGLDVERISDVNVEGLSRTVLHPDERGEPDEFFTYWTRKEAVVKATGDGLGVPLADVRVSGPTQRPEILSYPGRDGLPARLVDLRPAPGYRAALAVLTAEPIRIIERPAAELLTSMFL